MRAGWNTALELLVRRPDSPARIMIDARVDGAADLRQRYDQWQGLDALPANAELLLDGGVRLKATAVAGPQSVTVTSGATYVRDKASGAGPPNLDPLQNDAKDRIAALVVWGGADSALVEVSQVEVWLHPRFDQTVPKTVARWRLDLFTIAKINALGPSFELLPIGTVNWAAVVACKIGLGVESGLVTSLADARAVSV